MVRKNQHWRKERRRERANNRLEASKNYIVWNYPLNRTVFRGTYSECQNYVAFRSNHQDLAIRYR
jgi:hypothetical protein